MKFQILLNRTFCQHFPCSDSLTVKVPSLHAFMCYFLQNSDVQVYLEKCNQAFSLSLKEIEAAQESVAS